MINHQNQQNIKDNFMNTRKGWFWKLKMRNQVLIQLVTTFILILIIALGIYLLNIQYIIPQLERWSCNIYGKQAKQTLTNHLNSYDGILNGIFHINIHQLEVIQTIYNRVYQQVANMDNIELNYSNHMNYAGVNQIPSILVDLPKGTLAKTHSFMCYTNKTNITYPMNKTTLINLKIQEQMYPIGQILDQIRLNIKSLFYIATLEPPNIYFSYPCTCFGYSIYNLNLSSRAWYQKGLQIYNQSNFTDYDYQFTKPFLCINCLLCQEFTKDKIEVSLIMPLLDDKYNLKGIMSSDLGTDFNSYIVKTDQTVYMALLTDQTGILIYHSYNVSLSLLPIYFYNTSLTGFNYEDWNAVINTGISNCDQFQFQQNLICRYNTLFNQDLIITKYKIEQFNYYLMIFHDNTYYYNYLFGQTEDLIQQQYKAIQNIFLVALLILLISLIIASIIIIMVFLPMQGIIKNCCLLIGKKLNQKNLEQNILVCKISAPYNNGLLNLFLSYQNLVSKFYWLSSQKSVKCRQIESLQQFPNKIKPKSHSKLYFSLINSIQLIELSQISPIKIRIPLKFMGKYLYNIFQSHIYQKEIITNQKNSQIKEK